MVYVAAIHTHRYTSILSLALVLIFSLMFFRILFIFWLPLKFSKAANLFDILTWYFFLTSNSLSFLRLNLSTSNCCVACLLTASFPNSCNHQILKSIRVTFTERTYIENTQMSSSFYPYVINLIVSFFIRWGPGILMNISMRENHALSN